MNRHARPGTIRRALGAACIFGILWIALIVTP